MTPTPQRARWKSGFLVSGLARKRWNQALVDIWFQGVIEVGNVTEVSDRLFALRPRGRGL